MTPSKSALSSESGLTNTVRARRLGLDTQYEAVVFMHKDCPVCRSEGFGAHARVAMP